MVQNPEHGHENEEEQESANSHEQEIADHANRTIHIKDGLIFTDQQNTINKKLKVENDQ